MKIFAVPSVTMHLIITMLRELYSFWITYLNYCADSKHVKSGFISGVFQSIVRGMQYREKQGDYNQQGGSFIIGPGKWMKYHYTGQARYGLAVSRRIRPVT